MKISIPICRQRIAPLFESAETFLLFERGQSGKSPSVCQSRNEWIDSKCRRLIEAGVTVLLCGAISRQWQTILEQRGVEVHSFLAGEVQEILRAYSQEGAAGLQPYAMPGRVASGGRARRRRNCRKFFGQTLFQEEYYDATA